MAPTRIVEAVDVLKDGSLGLAAGWPVLAPEHLGLHAAIKTTVSLVRLFDMPGPVDCKPVDLLPCSHVDM